MSVQVLSPGKTIASGGLAWLDGNALIAMRLVAVLVVVAVTARTFASMMTDGDIEHTSGTWIAMAADARDGTLYRPIVSELGYGGTRYAPLFPAIDAAMLKMGLGYTASGNLISIVCVAMILIGAFILMRKFGADATISATAACFILAGTCVNASIAANKADLLAAMLNLWAMVLIAGIVKADRSIAWANVIAGGFICALAVATKVTSIFSLVAAIVWLCTQHRKTVATVLAVVWAILVLSAILLAQWASDGRALAVFHICAMGGGGIHQFIMGPVYFLANGLAFDRLTVLFWLLAMSLLALSGAKHLLSLPSLMLLATSLGTLAIFGTPGININHLMDLYIATMIFLAVQWNRFALRSILAIAMLIALAVKSFQCFQQARELWENPVRSQMIAAMVDADASPAHGQVLSENPLLPLLNGRRPYILDSFMLRVVTQSHPDLTHQFWQDLDNGRFAAVILSHSPQYAPMYERNDFGNNFIHRLNAAYALKSQHGNYYVYWPKAQ
jgi:hypothetical protein